MPVVKLQIHELRLALATFLDQGVPNPGQLRLLEHIGHGSLPRLKKLLYQIEQEDAGITATAALPDPLAAKVAEVWAEMERDLADKQADIDAYLIAEQQRLASEQAQFAERKRLLEQQAQDLTAQCHGLQEALAALRLHLLSVERERDRRGVEMQGQTLRIEDYKEQRSEGRRLLAQTSKEAALREQVLQGEVAGERDRGQAALQVGALQFRDAQAGWDAERQRLEAEKQGLREQLLGQIGFHEKHAATLTQQLNQVRDELKARAGQLDRLNAQASGLQKRLGELEATLAERDKRVAAFAKQLDTASAEQVGLRDLLAEARAENKWLQAQVVALKAQVKKIR